MASKKKRTKLAGFYIIDDLKSSKTKKRLNKKSHKGRWYGGVGLGVNFNGNSGDSDGGGVGESVVNEYTTAHSNHYGVLPGTFKNVIYPPETEEQSEVDKVDMARSLFSSLIDNPNFSRKKIIGTMKSKLGVTDSTAVSYYQRFAKQAGISGRKKGRQRMAPWPVNAISAMPASPQIPGAGGQLPMTPPANYPAGGEPQELKQEIIRKTTGKKQGIIRTVDSAHLIYKKQSPDGKFEELWVYNIGKYPNTGLSTRKDILSGTDIPPLKTSSPDGSQEYTVTTIGNAQILHIKGLPN